MSTDTALDDELRKNLRAADRLVNTLGVQRDAEERAYQRGWNECGQALAYIVAELVEAAYDNVEADRQAEWEALSAQIRARAGGLTFEQKRAAEQAACGPRPGDFPGLENDPTCLEPIWASVESITHKHTRAAA